MNRDRVEGNWKRFSGGVRARWGRLTGDESAVNAGKRDQLAGSIQALQGRTQEESAHQLKEFHHRNRDWNLSRR
jgi:uncharacterized protein YjbJ (UPF0337 family)